MVTAGLQQHPTTVWLTEWQVAEDQLDVRAGSDVAWTLNEPDPAWLDELFDGRRAVDLELDTYAHPGTVPGPALLTVRGTVESVEAVLIRRASSTDGSVPVRGSARAQRVRSTLELRGAMVARVALDVAGYIVTLTPGATAEEAWPAR